MDRISAESSESPAAPASVSDTSDRIKKHGPLGPGCWSKYGVEVTIG